MSTDPLADWKVERDVVRGMPYAHTLQLPEHMTHYWLTDAEADQFEQAKAITAAWAERGDDDPYDYLLTMARQGCFCEGNRKPCERHDAYADGLEAGLAHRPPADAADTPARPADDLPEGVHRIDGRLWLLPEHPLPKGWERGAMYDEEAWRSDDRRDGRTFAFIVRRRPTPPPPAVERVPWWEALGRALPDGRIVTQVVNDVEGGPFVRSGGQSIFPLVEDDGAFEVRVEPEGGA